LDKITNFFIGGKSQDKQATLADSDPYYVTGGAGGYPASQVGFDDYEYGDYDEGVGLYPPRPLTISERVFKWFDGFKPPSFKRSRRIKPRLQISGGPPLDYDDYDTDEHGNLVFYGGGANPDLQQQQQQPLEVEFNLKNTLKEFLNDLKGNANETDNEVDVLQRLFGAAVNLSERQDSDNSVFMMWTIPTTILAVLGLFYTVAAVGIVGYKYSLFIAQGDDNQAISLLPILAVFTVPLVIGLVIVTARSSATGKLDISRLMEGDVGASMRQDFDGVDFTMDAIFGSSALLGIGWLVSITV